jgi:hypothetical protein
MASSIIQKCKTLVGRSLLAGAARGFALRGNDRKLNALTDAYKGKKAVIIGMGPSLKPADLSQLGDAVTFACNKIFLTFDETDWRPDVYSICDVLVAENNKERILEADFGNAHIIHSVYVQKELREQKNALFYRLRSSIERNLASNNVVLHSRLGGGILAGGGSVVLDQIELAYAMGFSEVYLIGVDFSFKVPASGKKGMSISGEVIESEGEVNHFHPDYRKPGETWTMPKLDMQEEAFSYCRRVFEADGRKLINASRSSKLEVLDRAAFDDIFPL